eukprot:gene28509-biopygen24102
MQFVWPDVFAELLVVLHPDLADGHRLRELVHDLADAAVDFVNCRVVEPRVVVGIAHELVELPVVVRQTVGLGHSVGHVDAESVDSALEPEPQSLGEVVEDLGVVPVQVGLFLGEDVQVPLAGCSVGFGDAGPCRAAEDARPVVRRFVAVFTFAVSEDVTGSLRRTGRRRQGCLEPLVLITRVVRDQVHGDLDSAFVG